jgi:uncharacterized RDD family membrane protein YckC
MQNEQTPKDLASVNEDQEIIVDVTDMQEDQEISEDIEKAEVEAVQESPDQEVPYDVENAEVDQDVQNTIQLADQEPYDDYITGETGGQEFAPEAKDKDVDIINTGRTYAGFFARLTAYLLDHLFLLIPAGIVRFILLIVTAGNPDHFINRSIFFRFSPADMILYAVSALYFILLTYITGRTLGKRIMRLKVVSAEERKPSFLEIVFRETFGRFLSAVTLCIGYLMIIIGDQKEALHDYLADTRVIYR